MAGAPGSDEEIADADETDSEMFAGPMMVADSLPLVLVKFPSAFPIQMFPFPSASTDVLMTFCS